MPDRLPCMIDSMVLAVDDGFSFDGIVSLPERGLEDFGCRPGLAGLLDALMEPYWKARIAITRVTRARGRLPLLETSLASDSSPLQGSPPSPAQQPRRRVEQDPSSGSTSQSERDEPELEGLDVGQKLLLASSQTPANATCMDVGQNLSAPEGEGDTPPTSTDEGRSSRHPLLLQDSPSSQDPPLSQTLGVCQPSANITPMNVDLTPPAPGREGRVPHMDIDQVSSSLRELLPPGSSSHPQGGRPRRKVEEGPVIDSGLPRKKDEALAGLGMDLKSSQEKNARASGNIVCSDTSPRSPILKDQGGMYPTSIIHESTEQVDQHGLADQDRSPRKREEAKGDRDGKKHPRRVENSEG